MEIKDKIIKLAGGGASPAIASYIQVPDPQPALEASGVSQGGTPELLDDKQRSLLYEKGLPSDVQQFFAMVGSFGSGLFASGLNPRKTNSEMMKINTALNRIAFNKGEYDRAIKTVTDNGGLSEFAISTTGRIIVQTEDGELQQMTPEEYKKNRDRVAALTNADLANLRSNNSELAYNNSVLTTISNGIGIRKINDLLWATINNIGKTTVQSDRFMAKSAGRIEEGLQELLSVGSPDGIYKVNNKQSTQTDKAKFALDYLYTTLPDNAKTLLQARAIDMGLDPKTGAYELIASLVQSGLTDDFSSSIDYDKASTAALTGDGEKEGTPIQLSAADLIISGESNDRRTFVLNPNSNTEYVAPDSRVWNVIPTNDGKVAPIFTTVEDALANTILGTLGRKDSVSFGDEVIPDTAFNRIVIDTKAGVAQVFLPYRQDDQGRIVPDYDTLFIVNETEADIAKRGNITEQEKQEIYRDAGIQDYYGLEQDPYAAYRKGLLRPFLAVSGVAVGDEQIGIQKGNRAVEKLGSDEKKAWRMQMQRVYQSVNPDDKNYKLDSWLAKITGLDYNYYRGTVLIPVSDDRVTAQALSGHIFLPKSSLDARDVLRRGQSIANGFNGLRQTNFNTNGQ